MRRKRGGGGLGRPVSFPDGLGELPRGARARRSATAAASARAAEIAPISARHGGWRVATADGAAIESERLVLATPAAATAALLAPHAPAAAAALRAIPHAPVAVVCLGFRAGRRPRASISTPTASWSRAARACGLLGCQYETSVFPDRAPEGGVLLRALLGGTFDPGLVDADDDAIAAQAVGDLRRVAGPRARSRLRRRLARAPRNPAIRSRRTPRACAPSTTRSRGCPGSP